MHDEDEAMKKRTLNRILNEARNLEAVGGMDMHEMLNISDELRQVLTWIIRANRFQVEDLAQHMSIETASAQSLLDLLMLKGYVEFETAEPEVYHASVTTSRFTRRYVVPKDVWNIFDD